MGKRVLVILAALALLSGCNMALREADMLTIVSGVAVDTAESGYALTIEIARPEPTGEAHKAVTIESRGATLIESMKQSINLTGRRLYFTHADVLILGREAAQSGVSALLDAIIRQNELPLTVRMLVSDGGAGDILKAAPVMDEIASREIKQALTSNSELSEAPDVELYAFASRVLESGVDGYLPLVKLEGEGDSATQRVQGAALFAGDTLAAVIDEQLTQCLLWMSGETTMGVLAQGENAFNVSNVRAKITATSSGASIKISFDIFRSEGGLSEAESVKYVHELLEKRMRELLSLTRQNACDPIGLGREIKRRDPRSWQALEAKWGEHYKDYPVELELEVNYISTGRTNG